MSQLPSSGPCEEQVNIGTDVELHRTVGLLIKKEKLFIVNVGVVQFGLEGLAVKVPFCISDL